MEAAVMKPQGTIYYDLYSFRKWMTEEFQKEYTEAKLRTFLDKFTEEFSRHSHFANAQLWEGYYHGKRDNFSKFMREVFKRFGTNEINLVCK